MSKPVPPHLYNLLARELERGERVAWYACPPPLGRALDSIPGLLFGILVIGFALHWTWGATEGFTSPAYGLGLIEYLGGGMLALVGVSGLLSPLWAARWLAPRTLYAITDRRAIHIEIPVRRAIVRSFAGEQLEGVVRREWPSGRGDLIFERAATTGPEGRKVYRDVGFYGIEDVRAVQRLLPVPSAPPAPARRRG